MQLLSSSREQQIKLFYWLLAATMALVVLTAKQSNPAVYASGIVLALVSIYPFYFWLLGWSQGLPIWPVFCLVNGLTAALPLTQDPNSLDLYTSAEIITGGMTWVCFLLVGTVVWLSLSAKTPKPPSHLLMIARQSSEFYLFCFVGAGLFFQVNQMTGWIPLPGNTMQIVRGVAMSLNSMGIFVLSFFAGRGLLSRGQQIFLVGLTAATCLVIASGLILASAVIVLAMYFLGYMLGASRVPWKGMLVVFVVFAVLHPGKFAMRDAYWLQGKERVTLMSLPSFYGEWARHGLEELGGVQGIFSVRKEEGEVSSVFERGGTMHMLLLVQRKTPSEVPFFNGKSYEFIPRLLLPRFVDDQKGGPHAANIMLTVNYGLQTLEQTQTTSIGWGLVPEAYANFGYVGVAAVAVAVSAFYAIVSRLTVGVPMTSLRFVIGLLIMAVAVRADTMALFVTMQFQSVVGVSLAAFVLMRRQGNPFAEEAANGGTGQEVEGKWGRQGMEHGAWSMEQGAGGSEANRPRAGAERRQREAEPRANEKTKRPQVGPAKWGGYKPPKWAPLSHRRAFELAAARRKAEAATDVVDEKNMDEGKTQRPRQVAVPIQPYYYRSRKA